MITDFAEQPVKVSSSERRSIRRLVPTDGAMPAQVFTGDGRTHEAVVGDVTANGVRLIGSLPVTIGDQVRLQLHLDPPGDPFDTNAVVTSHDTRATGAHFTR